MAGLTIEVRSASGLTPNDRAAILDLCSRAYEEDFAPLLAQLLDPIHVIGRRDDRIVTHAAWVTRWLPPADMPILRTAYIEAVATLPELQGRGHATAILAALPPLFTDFDVAALPVGARILRPSRLDLWQGRLSVRTPTGLEPTPDETAMILRLPRTPFLDPTATLSIEHREGEVW